MSKLTTDIKKRPTPSQPNIVAENFDRAPLVLHRVHMGTTPPLVQENLHSRTISESLRIVTKLCDLLTIIVFGAQYHIVFRGLADYPMAVNKN